MNKVWYQLTLFEFFICMSTFSLFAYANTFQFSVGSGFWIGQQGIPFPFVTIYPFDNSVKYDHVNLGINIVVGVTLAMTVVAVCRWLRRLCV